jgi:hypothetical protein
MRLAVFAVIVVIAAIVAMAMLPMTIIGSMAWPVSGAPMICLRLDDARLHHRAGGGHILDVSSRTRTMATSYWWRSP